MNVLGCCVLHSDTVAVGGNTTGVAAVSAETSRSTNSGIEIAAFILESLPSIMAQVGVVAEDETAAPTGGRAASNDDGLVDAGTNQLRALWQLYRNVLVIRLRL